MEFVFVLPQFLAEEPVIIESEDDNSEGYTSRIFQCCQ